MLYNADLDFSDIMEYAFLNVQAENMEINKLVSAKIVILLV